MPLTAKARLPATTTLSEAALTLPALGPVADAVAVHFPAATAARALLADGELGLFALRHVAFRAR